MLTVWDNELIVRGNDDASSEVAECLESSGRAPGKKNLEAHEPQISWGQVGTVLLAPPCWDACISSRSISHDSGFRVLFSSLENKVFCCFFMQEKWPPTMRKFHVFIAAISDLVCVCLCLGQAGRFSKCARLFPSNLDDATSSWENSVFLLWLSPAYVCVRRDATGVMWKFRIFVAAISGLCVCVCVCVCVCMCCDVRRDRVVWKFYAFIVAISAYVCLFALLFVWTGPGWLRGARQLWVFPNLNWMCSLLPVATFCNFNFWILLRNKWILNWTK